MDHSAFIRYGAQVAIESKLITGNDVLAFRRAHSDIERTFGALILAYHSRVGRESHLRSLPSEIFLLIFRMYAEQARKDAMLVQIDAYLWSGDVRNATPLLEDLVSAGVDQMGDAPRMPLKLRGDGALACGYAGLTIVHTEANTKVVEPEKLCPFALGCTLPVHPSYSKALPERRADDASIKAWWESAIAAGIQQRVRRLIAFTRSQEASSKIKSGLDGGVSACVHGIQAPKKALQRTSSVRSGVARIIHLVSKKSTSVYGEVDLSTIRGQASHWQSDRYYRSPEMYEDVFLAYMMWCHMKSISRRGSAAVRDWISDSEITRVMLRGVLSAALAGHPLAQYEMACLAQRGSAEYHGWMTAAIKGGCQDARREALRNVARSCLRMGPYPTGVLIGVGQ